MKPTILLQNKKQCLFLFLIILVAGGGLQAQPCNVGTPQLFGNPVDKVVCRGSDAQLGVNGSVTTQKYFFNVNNGTPTRIGGPLIGNGGQLSVAARVNTSADAGQYYVETRDDNNCWATNPGFYVYYGNIDDLSITAWGNNSVSFSWASCGRSPYVRYEYAVTTEPNPDLIPDTDTVTTFNISATKSGLTAGTLYYIHVRVLKVYQQPYGNNDFNGPEVSNECFSDYPWSTIRFTSCAGAAPIGAINITAPAPIVCTGYGTELIASQGLTYQWYRNGASLAPSGNTANLIITQPGVYSTFITTSAGCQGVAYSKYIKGSTAIPGILLGGGSFCAGEVVRLKIRATQPDQAYEIRKDGQPVTSFWGIGTSFGSPPTDTIYYEFIITSPSQAGNYKVATSTQYCPSIIFGNQDVVLLSTASNGSISGTATVPQHVSNTSNITFTASGGVTPYTFTYTINGGANQTITTTGANTSVTVSQSNAVAGTFVYSLVSFTNGAGCTGTVTAPNTATISVVIPAPDMTNSQFFSTTQLGAGGTIQEVIGIRNVGTAATTAPIVFTVTNYSALTGLTATSNNNPSVTIGFTTYTLTNVTDWNVTSSASALTFTSKPGIVINPGVPKFVGVTISRAAGANGSVTHSSTVTAGTGGGDGQINNNSISNTLLKN